MVVKAYCPSIPNIVRSNTGGALGVSAHDSASPVYRLHVEVEYKYSAQLHSGLVLQASQHSPAVYMVLVACRLLNRMSAYV